MNKILISVAIIAIGIVSLIAGIVIYQFIQQQTDRQDTKVALQEEFNFQYIRYHEEAQQKCGSLLPQGDEPESMALRNCILDVAEKYGLFDSKYNGVNKDIARELG